MESAGPSAAGGPRGRPREAEAFDRWLRKQLHELYGSIAREPSPVDLIALIDRAAEELLPSGGVDCIDTA
jgi:hypothetical protein